ncbi:hypothetical protein [uncultured Desulfobacter sp.]|uniref:hypothetical protein n=1 Tax=uncultured Desulfobacter sp. TaxID=240139 RepID=UPI0029C8466D|nr:hypothetical protein [uncultured Desulfobacter sp.]
MKPISRGELQNNIQSAEVFFDDKCQPQILGVKKDSYCHFFDPFIIGDDDVKLRLDWNDLDSNGYPTLDADFYDIKTGKQKKLKSARLKAHHTKASTGKGRAYEWRFNGASYKFRIVVHWVASSSEKITIGDEVTAKVIKKKSC